MFFCFFGKWRAFVGEMPEKTGGLHWCRFSVPMQAALCCLLFGLAVLFYCSISFKAVLFCSNQCINFALQAIIGHHKD